MGCVACARELPEGAAFCPACGAPQSARGCSSCGSELAAGAAFCFRCGTPVAGGPAAVAERRVTSVLFADLVSYTTLSESRDHEDVRALLNEYFEVCTTVIRRYGGVVEKFIGDAVMAVWGVPAAHEDDAERTVRAGLELVAAVAGLGERLGIDALALRAGVVTGEVAANLGATDQGMVAGDAVNTAARIQAAASPGEVWVDATTRTLTAAAVTYHDVGEHYLKGKSEPVPLYRAGAVVSARGRDRVDGLEAPMVGRERQMRMLKELFHATEESGRPNLVVVDGEAGVGKTRLGWEFEKYIDGLSGGVAWHRGRCLSYGEGVAFWALSEMVRARVGAVEEDAGSVVLAGLDQLLDTVVPDDEERDWLRPRLASLLGEEGREFSRHDLFAAWTRFFERIGEGDPVVLLIDDAQYADEGLLDFVEHVMTNAGSPIYVLVLARPELLDQRPGIGGRRASVVRVENLPDPLMAELVNGLVEGLDESVTTMLVQRAEGVPLFAVETVRALIDRDLVVPVGGRYIVAPGRDVDIAEIGAPASLHALIAARLDALSSDERRVITDASVLGEYFTREGIGILAADVEDLDEVLSTLQRKELIGTNTDRFSAERGQFHFVQSVVRQVAYSTLTHRDRKSRHLQVAEHLSEDLSRADDVAQVIAQHLSDAADASGPGDADVAELRQRAADLRVTAGDRACALGSYADGRRAYEAALPHLTGVSRAVVLRKMSSAAWGLTRYDDVIATATQAMELFDEAGDALGAAGAAAQVARALGNSGRHEEALALSVERRASIEDVPDSDLVAALLLRNVAGALQNTGRWAEAVAPLQEALRLTDRTGDVEALVQCMNSLAVHQVVDGSRQVARLLFDGIAEIAREHEMWEELGTSLVNQGYTAGPINLAEGIELSLAAIENQKNHGGGPLPPAYGNLTNWYWLTGRWEELRAHQQAIDGFETTSPITHLSSAAVDQLLRWAGALGRSTPREPDPSLMASSEPRFVSAVRAATALADGDLPSAVQHARALVTAEFEGDGYHDDFHIAWPLAFRVAIAAGDEQAIAELRGYVDGVPDRALPGGVAGHAKVFRALLGMRDPGADPAAVEAEALAGIEALDAYGGVVWRAHAQEDLGRWLVRQGRAEAGVPHLEAARATYEGLGATAWLERLSRVDVAVRT